MRRVRCPSCSVIIQAAGDIVTCSNCGLTGRVDGPQKAEPTRAEIKARKAAEKQAAKAAKAAQKAAAIAAAERAAHVARAAAPPAAPAPAPPAAAPAAPAAPAVAPKPARDPWQITIDLRMINPANWPAGGRAFVVVLLIAAAFVGGGFAGVAFERAKADVMDDLGDGVFGSGSGSNDATTDPGGNDPGVVEGDPVPDPPVSTTTIRHEFKHSDVDPAVTLEGGLVRVVVSYDDDGSHSIFRLKFSQNGSVVRSVSATSTGPYEAVRYLQVPAGDYDLSVGSPVETSTWMLRIEEPRGETSGIRAGAFSEHGDDGVGPIKGSGDMDVTFTASKSGAGQVKVKAYRADGSQISACGTGTGFASTEPDARYSEAWKCSVGAATLVYFDIAHPTDPGGTWTLEIA